MKVAGIDVEFLLFAATLIGVAVFHRRVLLVACIGLASVVLFKAVLGSFDPIELAVHEGPLLLNLLGLLVGFELLAKHFEASHLPDRLPHVLPDDWKGGLVLLALVFVLSAFLDNIAAALIGGAAAKTVYRGRVHLAFLASIVAAANAGGAGSVLGDTTTTMMWIAGKSPLAVLEATIGAAVAFGIFGVLGSLRQHKHQPIAKDDLSTVPVDRARLAVVALILVSAIVANLWFDFPAAGVWFALLVCAPFRRPSWGDVPAALRGSAFLLALVLCASLMPVRSLPTPTWLSTLALGFVSAVFDNIPLTKLALDQGGYDWGFLAYAVGFGGSMMWFGSSAGVALSTLFPEAKSVGGWLRAGWFVPIAYAVGFGAMPATVGWNAG